MKVQRAKVEMVTMTPEPPRFILDERTDSTALDTDFEKESARPTGESLPPPNPPPSGSRSSEGGLLVPSAGAAVAPAQAPLSSLSLPTDRMRADARALLGYVGAGTLKTTPEERAALLRPVSDDDVKLKPNGIVYVSGEYIRARLFEVFGTEWSLVPFHEKPVFEKGTVVYYGALYVRGCFVTEANGECEWQETNKDMTWFDALEGAKTSCLTRCAKYLIPGITSLWDKTWIEAWKKRAGVVKVWVKNKDKPQFRRPDAEPFYNETGIVEDRPRRPVGQAKAKPQAETTEPPSATFDEEPRPAEEMPPDFPTKGRSQKDDYELQIKDIRVAHPMYSKERLVELAKLVCELRDQPAEKAEACIAAVREKRLKLPASPIQQWSAAEYGAIEDNVARWIRSMSAPF